MIRGMSKGHLIRGIKWLAIDFPDDARTATTPLTSHQTCWSKTSSLRNPTKNGPVTSVTSGPARGGCIWRSTIVLGPMADKVSLLDLHSRPSPVVLEPMANNWRVIGWAVSNRMKRDPSPGR